MAILWDTELIFNILSLSERRAAAVNGSPVGNENYGVGGGVVAQSS